MGNVPFEVTMCIILPHRVWEFELLHCSHCQEDYFVNCAVCIFQCDLLGLPGLPIVLIVIPFQGILLQKLFTLTVNSLMSTKLLFFIKKKLSEEPPRNQNTE